MNPWLLYGANGYTGTLIAEEAVRRGLRPILAGRRRSAIAPLAERLGLPYRIFSLSDGGAVRAALKDMRAVLLAAGPFSATSEPVRDACLATGCHYLDITGEIDVLEACRRQGPAAARAGVVLLPGVGFDVVPSDCLAASLHAALPTATHLELAIHIPQEVSRGTAKSMVEGLALRSGAVRRDGALVEVPAAHAIQVVPFADQPRICVTIPWGDLSTAHVSTGIPNIEVYFSASRPALAAARWLGRLRPLLRVPGLVAFVQKVLGWLLHGPGAQARATRQVLLWGRARDPSGSAIEGTLRTPDGYALTVLTALACVERVLRGGVAPGMQTPSLAFGPDFITQIDGCALTVRSPRPEVAA
jgi:saccharopine dehydrogenase (NAD+, L-lysine-forming)